MKTSPWKLAISWLAAIVLTAVGAITVLITPPPPIAFGWFAYAPLSESVFTPEGGVVILAPTAILGAAASVAGLIALGVLVGWHFGKKAAQRTTS